MFAPEQKILSFALVKTTAFTSGCSKRMRVESVGQLDVDAQVVRVELERIAGPQPAVLLHVHRDPRHRPRVLGGVIDPPVAVAIGVGLEADRLGRGVGLVGAHVAFGFRTTRRTGRQVV